MGACVGGTGVSVTTITTGVTGPIRLLRSQARSDAPTSMTVSTTSIEVRAAFVFICPPLWDWLMDRIHRERSAE
jgi:hypothetical protein